MQNWWMMNYHQENVEDEVSVHSYQVKQKHSSADAGDRILKMDHENL